jgi:superfamily I DNA and/or RNA helicase
MYLHDDAPAINTDILKLDQSRHVSLIGDHKQLPPVITSTEAQEGGLGISLFERLTEEGGMFCLVCLV